MPLTNNSPKVSTNIIANLSSSFWVAATGFISIPFYIRYLGIEAYGLIGVISILQSIGGLMNFGLNTTLSREMARLSVDSSHIEKRDVLRTIEIAYWVVGVAVALFIVLLAPLIAKYWIKYEGYTYSDMRFYLSLCGVVIMLQLSYTVYSSGLMGLQKQVLMGGIDAFVMTLKNLGGIFVLCFISPTISAFFYWQIFSGAVATILVGCVLWKQIPGKGYKGRFDVCILKKLCKFTAGITGITFMAILLTQIDKVILSKMLALEDFGYYTLAGTIASTLLRISGPIVGAVSPRLTQLVAQGVERDIASFYHRSCQFVSLLIIPAAVVVSFFSFDFVAIWTGSQVTAVGSSMIVSVLILGTMFNVIAHMPYGLQLAYGWTRLQFMLSIYMVAFAIPSTIIFTQNYGALGGAYAWLVLNILYVVVMPQLMHLRILRNEKWSWYWRDVFSPFVSILLVVGFFKVISYQIENDYVRFFVIALASIIAFLAGAFNMNVKGYIVERFWRTLRPGLGQG